MFRFNVYAIMTVLAASGSVMGSTVVLDEHFLDGNLNNGTNTGETDTQWYFYNNSTGGSAYTASTDSGGLLSGTVMRNASGSATNSLAIGGFSSVTLSHAGDSITLSFDYRITTADTSKRMFFGLFNDASTPVAANEFGPASSTSADDVGYNVMKFLSNSTSATLYQKDAATGTKSLNDALTSLTAGLASTASLANTDVHHVELSMTRSDSGLIIATNIDSTGASSFTVSSPVTYTFNEVGLSANPTTGVFLWDNIVVTADIVPEPASLLTLAAGVLLIGARRRNGYTVQ